LGGTGFLGFDYYPNILSKFMAIQSYQPPSAFSSSFFRRGWAGRKKIEKKSKKVVFPLYSSFCFDYIIDMMIVSSNTGGIIMYEYRLYDGVEWHHLYRGATPLDPAEARVMADEKVEDWDYHGVSQRLDIYEFQNERDRGTKIGSVETPGRLYQCRACYSFFPHPPQELPVCRCGNVATHDDLEEE